MKGELSIENCIENGTRITTLEQKVSNLEVWQEKQNGTLQDIQKELKDQSKNDKVILYSVIVNLTLLILNFILGRLK